MSQYNKQEQNIVGFFTRAPLVLMPFLHDLGNNRNTLDYSKSSFFITVCTNYVSYGWTAVRPFHIFFLSFLLF